MSRTSKKLDKVYKKAPIFIFKPGTKLVFFSDHHKGDGEKGSDDFQRNTLIYRKALEWYFVKGYTLVLVGDVEEMWECKPSNIFNWNGIVYQLEKRFHDQGRLIKIVGNHDFIWYNKKNVKKYLDSIFPGIEVYEGIRVIFANKNYDAFSEYFVCHGHQGEFLSDTILGISKFFVRWFWKPFQYAFRVSATSAVTNYKKRNKREKEYCIWASDREVRFIVGHTHRPRIFSIIGNIIFNEYALNCDAYVMNTGCCAFPNECISAVELSGKHPDIVEFWIENGEVVKKSMLK